MSGKSYRRWLQEGVDRKKSLSNCFTGLYRHNEIEFYQSLDRLLEISHTHSGGKSDACQTFLAIQHAQYFDHIVIYSIVVLRNIFRALKNTHR